MGVLKYSLTLQKSTLYSFKIESHALKTLSQSSLDKQKELSDDNMIIQVNMTGARLQKQNVREKRQGTATWLSHYVRVMACDIITW